MTNYARISRNDDEPYTPDFWASADRAYIALKDFHYDGEVLDAVSIFLCSDRGPEALAELGKVIEALGDKAKDDYIANRSFAPEG